jgi:RimJ/RimL family protein N-acetyltransferase
MLDPIILEGKHVRLEPLSLEHLDDLCAVGLNPALWRMAGRTMETREDMKRYIEEAFLPETAGEAHAFATIDKASGKAVGSTRYGNIALPHKRLEIGWTWIGKPFQRTHINTEAKYLMLRHAFETLGLTRVELKANAKNEQSRRAMERIGAKYEGVLRRHITLPNGTVRDTVYYSIIHDEWEKVKSGLEAALQREYAPEAEEQSRITVHKADTRHLELLLPLFDGYRQFYKQVSNLEGAEAFLTERIMKQESVIFVALVGNKGAGFTQLYPSFSSVTMQRQWILNDLFVDPEFRKFGVADAIMRAAEEFSYADNAKGLVLSTAVDNLPAQALYEKRGWKRDEAFYTYEKYFAQA